MNLLDIAQKAGRTYRRVSTIHGGEYHGPCPKCGGEDRFHIWPEQDTNGSWWCRQCDKGGDAIQYLIDIEGMTFPAACKELGRELPDQEEFNRPRFKPPQAAAFVPREITAPADLWVQHATKLLEWSHQQLLNNEAQLNWLAARGLDLDAVKKYRLGWNPGENGKDLYRAREAWGLETVLKDDGKKKKLWLPIGLVIPCFIGDTLHRVRIRQPEGQPRYYLVPGSGTAPMILGPEAKAFVVIESELDAMLVHHAAGDLAGAISQGNSTAKPDAASLACLKDSLAILVALDSDEAGMLASVWWKKQFPQAERHPVPVGKDPGEAYKAGVDIRGWVESGLPPVFTLPKKSDKRREMRDETTSTFIPHPSSVHPYPSSSSIQDYSGAGIPAAPPEREQPVTVHTLIAKDGRTFHITDDQAAYNRLIAAAQIVFTFAEIAMIKQTGADQDAAARFLDFKQAFPGIKVTEVTPIDCAAGTRDRPRYMGKFTKD